MARENTFLVSVANAIGRDPNTGAGIFIGKANISSAFTVSTTAVETRGGIGNPLLYIYYHSRKVEIKVSSATFEKSIIALNVGTDVLSGTYNVVNTECVTLSSNVGTLTYTPLSDVAVYMTDGTVQNITPVGKTFTTVGGANTVVDVVYEYSVAADQIVASANIPPKVIDMTLVGEIRDSTNTVVNYINIRIPRFQISGNYTLSFAANGVSNQDLDGMALAVNADDCSGGSYFAKITYMPAVASNVSTASIVAIPSTLSFTTAGGTQAVKVLGIRGTSTVDVTTSCSFVVGGAASASFVAGLHTGSVMISASAAALLPSGSMVVTYWDAVGSGSRTDWVNLLVA